MFAVSTKRVLPGFTLSLGTSLLFVCLILLLPLSALVMQLAQMSWAQYWDVVTNPQVVAAYKVTLLSAFVASIFNGVFGLLMLALKWLIPGISKEMQSLTWIMLAGLAAALTMAAVGYINTVGLEVISFSMGIMWLQSLVRSVASAAQDLEPAGYPR